MPSPKYKIFAAPIKGKAEYVASCHYLEDAAAIVAMRGTGATIRLGHSSAWTLWTEGAEAQHAGESYDFVANVAFGRIPALQKAHYIKLHGVEDYNQMMQRVAERQAANDASADLLEDSKGDDPDENP